MKAVVEDALARAFGEAVPGLALCAPQYASGELPDEGSSLVVSVEIEHRAGPASLANVTLDLATVNVAAGSAEQHAEYERAVKCAAHDRTPLDCGQGLRFVGLSFFVGIGGGVDGNRWVSSINFRYGLIEAL